MTTTSTGWAHSVRLEVWIPDPELTVFRLGMHPLGGPVPLAGAVNPFTLGVSKLGIDKLSAAGEASWIDITRHAASIDSYRGQRIDHPVHPPEPGDLTVTFINGPRLSTMGIYAGVKIRLIAKDPDAPATATGVIIWDGFVEDVDETEDREGLTTITTLTAYDDVRDLANRTRYGCTSGGTAGARFLRVATESSGLPAIWGADTDGPAVDSVFESSVDNWLTILAAGRFRWTLRHVAGLSSYLDEYGAEQIVTDATYVYAVPIAPSLLRATFSDEAAASRSYYQVSTRTGTSQLVTALDITNHARDASGAALDTTSTHVATTAAATHGMRRAAVDTMVPAANLPAVAAALLAPNVTPDTTVTALTVSGRDTLLYAEVGTAGLLGSLSPLDSINVVARGTTHQLVVAGVRHHLTPRRWRATLTTIRRKAA